MLKCTWQTAWSVAPEFQVTMTTGHASATGPTVTLVQLPNGQTVQVHGVIQAAQPSVIQSPQVQAVQVKHTCTILVLGLFKLQYKEREIRRFV